MRQRKRYTQVLIDLENGLVQPIGLSEYIRDDGQRDNFRGLMPNETPNLIGDRALIVAAQSFVNEEIVPRIALAEGDLMDNGVANFDAAVEAATIAAEQLARAQEATQERNRRIAELIGMADQVPVAEPAADAPSDPAPGAVADTESPQDQ